MDRYKCNICYKDSSADHTLCDEINRRREQREERLLEDNPWLGTVIERFDFWKETHSISEA